VRALIITFNMYMINEDYFTSVIYVIEFTVSGNIIPTKMEILPFRVSPFTRGDTAIEALQILRIFNLTYLGGLILYKLCALGTIENII